MAKTNLIWIMADQLRADMVGCNGDPNVHTPNIDALAAGGANFTRALSTNPLCCPARASMITGLYPQNCGVYGHEYRLDSSKETIADVLNRYGYHTAYIGKWHLDGWHEKVSRAAFHVVPPERRARFKYWMGYENNNSQYDCWIHGGDGKTEVPPTKLEGYETDAMTDVLINHLKTIPKDQPFFAVMSVQPPHNPYVAPERNRNYEPDKLILRPNCMPDLPPYKEFNDYTRKGLANAYAMIENFDENVGKIVKYLKNTGIYDNTILMVFSDHGDTHGSHGQQRKTNPYEESIRVPFIVGGKRIAITDDHVGIKLDCLLSSVDVAPTTLGLLGIDTPRDWEGCDYSVACKRNVVDFSYPESAYIQSIIPEHHPHSVEVAWRGVVTRDGWKYVCLDNTPWMLFDLNTDPYELRNLACCGLYRAQRARLSLMLQDWINRTHDNFRIAPISFNTDIIEHERDKFGYPDYPED